MTKKNPIVQVVLGEEKGAAGVVGEVVIDREHVPGVRITPVGLELTDPNLALEDWMRIGRMLGYMHRSINWLIGDWINKGEALYGQEASQGVEATVRERYDEAERVTGVPHASLLVVASVCQRVARSRRRSELGFSLHAVVARLDPDEQTMWLQRAVDDGMTREELRDALRGKGDRVLPPSGDGNNSDPGWDRMPKSERIEQAAKRVFHQGVVRGGEVHVPIEPWHQLASALDEE